MGASAENSLQMAAKDGGHENVIGDGGIHCRWPVVGDVIHRHIHVPQTPQS